MSVIRVTAHFRVKPGKADQFRHFAATLVEKVRRSERGDTSIYAFYRSSDDPAMWIAHEAFEDAEAFAKHVQNLTPEFRAASHLFDLVRSDICGDLPPPLASSLLGQSNVHRLFDSLVDSI